PDLAFRVEKPREFSGGHAVLHRDFVKGDKVISLAFADGAVDEDTADGVDPIEDNKGDVGRFCRLHGEAHRRKVGVETTSDVLDVEDEEIEPLHLFPGGFAGLTFVEAVNRKAGGGVASVIDGVG